MGKNEKYVYLWVLIIIGFFFAREIGFFSVSYPNVITLSDGNLSLTAESTREFGLTSLELIPENPGRRVIYWNTNAVTNNGQITLTGNTYCIDSQDGDCPPGADLQITESLIKTNNLNIDISALESLLFNLNYDIGSSNYGEGQSINIYLTDGTNDILIYSKGTASQGNSILKITQSDGNFFFKVNDEESVPINIPSGNYELMMTTRFGGLTQNPGEGVNTFHANGIISNIQIEENIINNETCTPNWLCNSWTNCTSNQQTRICIDTNNCGVFIGKPSESQTCTSSNETQTNQTTSGNSQSQTSNLLNSKNVLIGIAVIGIILGIVIWRKKK